MDMVRIGAFLKELRVQNHMTQEQLGEKLGVTNKTISRWECGTYLPPVEMLKELSDLYGLTINEIISGQRLNEEQFRQQAEMNIADALKTNAFTLKERVRYYKRKWLRDHIFRIVLCAASWIVLIVSLKLQGVDAYLIGTIGGLLAVIFYVYLYNQMMRYVENRAYDGSGK